jgi:spore germination cell wall hydrolase CwlJ-like protein
MLKVLATVATVISICFLVPSKKENLSYIDAPADIQQNSIVVPPSFEDIIQSIDEKSIDVHNKDIMCLAKDIFYEARDQSIIGKVAVAYVPVNRSISSLKSLCSIIQKKSNHVCQFTWVCHKKSNTKSEAVAWSLSLKIAHAVYNRLVDDPTNGAKFYYNPRKAHSHWAKFKNAVQTLYAINGFIGDHVFLKD